MISPPRGLSPLPESPSQPPFLVAFSLQGRRKLENRRELLRQDEQQTGGFKPLLPSVLLLLRSPFHWPCRVAAVTMQSAHRLTPGNAALGTVADSPLPLIRQDPRITRCLGSFRFEEWMRRGLIPALLTPDAGHGAGEW